MMHSKRRTFRSPAYLAFVRQWPCFCCGHHEPSDPSHYGGKGASGGMGLKPSDLYTAPLCRPCHTHWHQKGHLPGLTPEKSRERHLHANVLLLFRVKLALKAEPQRELIYNVERLREERDMLAAEVEYLYENLS